MSAFPTQPPAVSTRCRQSWRRALFLERKWRKIGARDADCCERTRVRGLASADARVVRRAVGLGIKPVAVVIAYSVTQRTREIGVRVALGADARAVTSLVVGGGLRLTTLGIMLGVVAAAASMRALASLLYGVSPADPFTFAAITLLVVVIALVALYVPARRALRIDPTEALRAA